MGFDFEEGGGGSPVVELAKDCAEDRAVSMYDGGVFPFAV